MGYKHKSLRSTERELHGFYDLILKITWLHYFHTAHTNDADLLSGGQHVELEVPLRASLVTLFSTNINDHWSLQVADSIKLGPCG